MHAEMFSIHLLFHNFAFFDSKVLFTMSAVLNSIQFKKE